MRVCVNVCMLNLISAVSVLDHSTLLSVRVCVCAGVCSCWTVNMKCPCRIWRSVPSARNEPRGKPLWAARCDDLLFMDQYSSQRKEVQERMCHVSLVKILTKFVNNHIKTWLCISTCVFCLSVGSSVRHVLSRPDSAVHTPLDRRGK